MSEEESACTQFSESLWDEFDRIDNMINPRSSDRVFVLHQAYESEITFKVYGLCNQARYGDVTGTREEQKNDNKKA